jgi:excisionase family DNA binding protein
VSSSKLSHPPKDQSQIKNETKSPAKLHPATDAGVLRIDPGPAVAPTRQLLQPLPTTNPEHPTHWEPSGSTPEPRLLDPQGQQVDRGRLPPGGRRPIVARLRRANGRSYGRPDPLDLRSSAYLVLGLSAIRAMHFASSSDRGGVDRNAPSEPTFFTERTLAAYLAVSDRTIRNWIRRGELPSYKLGASRRIDPADVDAFLEARREEAA